ncbi:MAG TPA: hypothetical protein EYQ27_18000, partial [Gemmatimonadetes bacterium]|nr:hypothetical protein [Gemmatimonadota bacterium]
MVLGHPSAKLQQVGGYGRAVIEHGQNRADALDVVERALTEAGLRASEIDAFAATRGPGLASSLLVGFEISSPFKS